MQKEISWLLKDKYHGKPTAEFYQDLERLKKGEPLDYLIGFTIFLGCTINLSKRPLIPRAETEFWMQQAIEELKKDAGPLAILDVFAGSGCIGISIMRHLPNVHVVFAEKDGDCVRQIRINCAMNKIKGVKIIQSDVFKNVKGKFDYIFANPPYISTAHKNNLQRSVLKYEPKMALFGGKDGLFYIRKFLASAKNFLNADGKIYLEFDSVQKSQIQAMLKKFGYKNWEFFKDQYGRFRWVVVIASVLQ